MKKGFLLCALILHLTVTFSVAQNTCQNQSVQQLANSLAQAFEDREMGKIDKTRPFLNGITVRTENSLADDQDPNRFEYKKLKNFTQFEKWLKSSEIERLPNRASAPLIRCKNGICTYNITGLLHNTLFLKKFSYGYKKNNCPFIKTVFLIDGN